MAEIAVGQIWRDEDGLKWRIYAIKGDWAYVKRFGYRTSWGTQMNIAWFDKWTLVRAFHPNAIEGEQDG